MPSSCLILGNEATDKRCSASGWEAIEKILTTANHLLPIELQQRYGKSTLQPIEIPGQQSLRNFRIVRQEPHELESGYDLETPTTTIQQAAIADSLSSTATLWNLALTNATTRGHGSLLESLDSIHARPEPAILSLLVGSSLCIIVL